MPRSGNELNHEIQQERIDICSNQVLHRSTLHDVHQAGMMCLVESGIRTSCRLTEECCSIHGLKNYKYFKDALCRCVCSSSSIKLGMEKTLIT